MMHYKIVDIQGCGEGATDEEIEILLKSPKPDYTEQLIAENYLDGSLEGYTLEFDVFNSIGKLKDVSYLSFKMNQRLKCICLTISAVIKCRGLNLEFECVDEIWTLLLNELCCDLIKDQVCENKYVGLLLRNYKAVLGQNTPIQNPPRQNPPDKIPLDKIPPKTKSPWTKSPIISPQTAPLLNTFCFI